MAPATGSTTRSEAMCWWSCYVVATSRRSSATSSKRSGSQPNWRNDMGIKTTPFDAADYLDTPEAQGEYLRLSFESEDPGEIQEALGTVARARGMSQIARDAGVGRESLYKALSGTGNPEFATVIRVLHALGLHLTVTPRHDPV